MVEQSARKLYRTSGPIAGVCGGVARYFDTDTATMRLLAVVLTVLSVGLGMLVYVALWLVLPKEAEVWKPVDVAPGQTTATKKTPRYRRLTKPRVGVAIGLAVGILTVTVCATTMLYIMEPHFPLGGFWAVLALSIGTARLVIPGKKGYSLLSIIEGGALFFIGLVVVLSLTDVISVHLEILFLQNWPLLLIALGALVVSYALDSVEIAALSLMAFVLFWTIGLLFYVDMGAATASFHAGPLGQGVPLKEVFFNG